MEVCSIPNCDKVMQAKRLCTAHWKRLKRHGSPTAGGPLRKRTPKYGRICSVETCSRLASLTGLCMAHYARKQKGQSLHTPFKQRRGTGSVNRDGYRVLSLHYRRVFEHRYVMEQLLGRPLRTNETVHHLNGDRQDNRPENLELWVKSQPAGQRVEDLVTWAKEILVKYDWPGQAIKLPTTDLFKGR